MTHRSFLLVCLSFLLAPSIHAADNNAPKATSPDGQRIARGEDKTIRVTDAATQKDLLSITGHTDKVTVLVYSPDGKLLASGSEDMTAKLWDAVNGKLLVKINGKNAVVSLSFSGDGKTLTITDSKQTTRKFDVATGKEIAN